MPTLQEMIEGLATECSDRLAELEEAKQKVENRITILDTMKVVAESEKAEAVAAAEVRARAEGVEAGFQQGLEQAGQAGGEGKIYSDAELNAEIARASEVIRVNEVAPLQTAVNAQEERITLLTSELASVQGAVADQIAEAKAATKAAMIAHVKEQRSNESASEDALDAAMEAEQA